MSQTFFVTGTDTDVGKTVCCKALIQACNQHGLSTLAYKPIAAGCEMLNGQLSNEDARILQEASSVNLGYDAINPIAFEMPIAPHIAAQLENKPIDLQLITQGLNRLQSQDADIIIVEGAGGWRLPLNDKQMLSDWVIEQELAVILVVGMKLGCLNHAILTYQSIINDGLKVVGWIANQLQEDMPFYEQNLSYLTHRIAAPKLGEIAYVKKIQEQNLSEYINLEFALK